jgi:hypothetical protein
MSLIQTGNEMPGENAVVAIERLRVEVEEWKKQNALTWEGKWLDFAKEAAATIQWPDKWRVQK